MTPHPDSVPDPDPDADPAPDSGLHPDPHRSADPDPDFLLFARKGCGEAFARLAARHVNAVFSTAARVLGGAHGHLAGDVAQGVFVLLARRAAELPERLNVFAWLHRRTVRLALNTVRGENRRRAREREFAGNQLTTMEDKSPENRAALWESVRPHLDQALLELRETDRQAILLRHFENRDLRGTGAALGLSAGAAQKRVSRALEALRSRLARRGITAGATVLAVLLTEHSVRAAPAGLLPAIQQAATALAATSATGGLASGWVHALFTMSKLKASLTGAVAGLCAGGAWIVLTPAPAAVTAAAGAGSAVRSPLARTLPPGGMMAADRLRVPVRSRDTAALFQQIRQVAGEFNNELTRQRLRGLMGQVRPEEFTSLYSFIEKECTVTEKDLLYPELTKCWGRTRPAEAMEAVMRVKSSLFRRINSEEMALNIFKDWHRSDPPGARQWLAEHSEERALGSTAIRMIGIIAQSLLEESPDVLFAWASQLQGTEYRIAALEPLYRSVPLDKGEEVDQTDVLHRIMKELAQEPDTEFAQQAAERCGALWGAKSPEEMQKVLAELPPSETAWKAALSFLADSEVLQKADRAELALRLAGDRPATEAVSEILRGAVVVTPDLLDWALPRLDPQARDAAILETVIRQSKWEMIPQNNRDWLSPSLTLRHSDPAVRDEMLRGIFQQALIWDPERAETFLNSCPWPQELKAVLLEAKAQLLEIRQKP